MAQINTVTGTADNDVLNILRGDAFQPGRLVAMLSGSRADGSPPVAQLLVNGQVVATSAIWKTDATGSHELSYTIPSGTNVTSVSVVYVNDLFTSNTEDRNLFVNSLSLNGRLLPLNLGTYSPEAHPVQAGERLMAWNGPLTFSGAVVQNAMGADTYTGNLTIDGLGGVDTLMYAGRFLSYSLSYTGGEMRIDSKAHNAGVDTVRNVERVVFDDYGINASSVTQDGNNRTINGGSGIDTVAYNGTRSEYTISRTSGGNYVVTHNGHTDADVLINVERLAFSDMNLAVDINGNGGQAYRLYQAAFDRAPEFAGLGFQMSALDNDLHLAQVANNFLNSPEFQATYGNLSNRAFVQQLYRNVLNREGEEAGVNFHTANLDNGPIQRFDVLVQFSESPENQANVIGTIQNGMVYTI